MSEQDRSTAVVDAPDTKRQLTDDERRDVMEQFRRVLDEIGERNKDKDPDEVLREVTEIVEEVRQERCEREQRQANGRR